MLELLQRLRNDIDASLQLEEAQGGVDEQARAQLDKLRQQTAVLSNLESQTQQAASTTQTMDEVALAGQLDKYSSVVSVLCNLWCLSMGSDTSTSLQIGWATSAA